MMKTNLFMIAIILCVVGTAFGQTSPTTEEAYTKWRDESLRSYPNGINTPHYCLIAKTQKIDDTTARIEFLVAGKLEQVTFNVQPLKIDKLSDKEFREVEVGKISDSQIKGINPGNAGKLILEMIVPVTTDTNGFRIVWKFKDGSSQEKRNTLTTWYKGDPDISIMSMINSGRQ